MADYDTEEDLFEEGDGYTVAYAAEEDLFEEPPPPPMSREQYAEHVAARAAEADREIHEEASEAGDPLGLVGDSDFAQGLGNPLNIQQGAARLAKHRGILDVIPGLGALGDFLDLTGASDVDPERLQRVIQEDIAARDPLYYGGGQLATELAAGGVLAPIAAPLGAYGGAAATGAAMGGASELNRTGDPIASAAGAGIGAAGGVAGRLAGDVLAKGAGKVLGAQSASEVARKAAGRADDMAVRMNAGLRGVGPSIPKPIVPSGSYGDAVAALPDDLARGVAMSPKQIRTGVEKGVFRPEDASRIIAAKSMHGLPESSALLDTTANLGGRLGPGIGPRGAQVTEALFSYADMMPAPSPTEVHADEHYNAFAEAYDDAALESRPGLRKALGDLMSGWSQGKSPAPAEVALMAYRLSEVPGLSWASLDPMRTPGEDANDE